MHCLRHGRFYFKTCYQRGSAPCVAQISFAEHTDRCTTDLGKIELILGIAGVGEIVRQRAPQRLRYNPSINARQAWCDSNWVFWVVPGNARTDYPAAIAGSTLTTPSTL